MPLIEDRGVSELTDMELEASEEMSESVRKTFTNYIDKYKVKSSPLKDENEQSEEKQILVDQTILGFDSESDYEKPQGEQVSGQELEICVFEN